MSDSLATRLQQDSYSGYAYAYPHKTSYRPISPAVDMSKAWRDEDTSALFLYVHLPFCEMRCGFCNLFTTVQPPAELIKATLYAIDTQSRVTVDALQPANVSQLAFGGGTPSYLTSVELSQLFRNIEDTWPIDFSNVAASFEVSPATIDAEKLQLLKSFSVQRISMGVQSFSKEDLNSLGRPQSNVEVWRAIEAIQAANFDVFNLDLIYGSSQQTTDRWATTLRHAIAAEPDELYLYPLYVRDLTGLGRTGKKPNQHRRELYQVARDALLDAGYEQQSMRLFRRPNAKITSSDYCCQEDGMIGLGPGARSYTRALHYSSEYAVGQTGVRRIIQDFNRRTCSEFSHINFGVWLDGDEQRRRYLIKSLLRVNGISLSSYLEWFGTDLFLDFPQLRELFELRLAIQDGELLRLTDGGLEFSDVIGPWLYSADVHARMEEYELV